MIPITIALLTNHTARPALRRPQHYRIRKVKAVVMHWTANTGRGANALANRNYFNLGSRPASAHYVVDDHSIVQCLPETEVGYHVGAKRYLPAGRALMDGDILGPNFYTLGIEMCVNSDGDWNKTLENSIQLAATLLHRHGLTDRHLLRHYDITGKDCPRMMIDPDRWKQFCALVELARLELELITTAV